SLPLNGGGGFGRDVVDDAVNAADFVDDALAHRRQDVVGAAGPVGGHGVLAGHRADSADPGIGPVVAHHAGGVNRQQHGKELPNFASESGFLDFFADDRIGAAEQIEILFGDLAQQTDRQT